MSEGNRTHQQLGYHLGGRQTAAGVFGHHWIYPVLAAGPGGRNICPLIPPSADGEKQDVPAAVTAGTFLPVPAYKTLAGESEVVLGDA